MTQAPPDAERVRILVERIQAGIDYQHGCAEVYRLFRRRVHGFFAVRRFTADESEELTQETFIRVFNAIEGLHSSSRFATWLFEIATNIYRNELRRRGAAKRDAFEESIEDLVESQAAGRSDALAALSSKLPDPLHGTMRREQLETLRTEISLLPPQMRRCVFLRLYQDLKYREIAALMRISIETVKAHLHQAQKRLRVAFSDRPDADETQDAL
jgi:RNA polymerase sigma-70 factor (ECF subfamily)